MYVAQPRGRVTERINILPCEGAKFTWKDWTIGEVCFKGLRPRKGFPQVFYTAEQGDRPIAFCSAECSLENVNARWIGYVGDG